MFLVILLSFLDASQQILVRGDYVDNRHAFWKLWRRYDDLTEDDIAFYLRLNHSRLLTARYTWRTSMKQDLIVSDTYNIFSVEARTNNVTCVCLIGGLSSCVPNSNHSMIPSDSWHDTYGAHEVKVFCNFFIWIILFKFCFPIKTESDFCGETFVQSDKLNWTSRSLWQKMP